MINTPIFRQQNSDTDFYRQWTCLTGLTMNFTIDEAQWVVFNGQMDVHHRGIVNGVIGFAGTLSIIGAPTLAQLPASPVWSTPPGERLEGSTNGGNILSETQHYGKIVWGGCKLLQPGAYRVMAHANSHSSISDNSIDGLAEVLVEGGKGLNYLIASFYDAQP
jgi:hypothetical protein